MKCLYEFFLEDVVNYTDVCNSFITCFSILIGVAFAYIIYWQTNDYLKKKNVQEKFNQLGDKLTLFRKLIFFFFNSDPWKDQHAISDYKDHCKNNMQDQMLEDIADNPFLKVYKVMNSIYSGIKHDDVYNNNYFPEYSLREIKNIQHKASVIWHSISERRDINDMIDNIELNNCVDNDFIRNCISQLSTMKFEKIDKYTIADIAGNIECNIIPKMEIHAKTIEKKNPPQIKVIIFMLLLSFLISVISPIVFLLFEISTLWVYLLLMTLLIIPIIIVIQQIRKLIKNEIKIKKGNN